MKRMGLRFGVAAALLSVCSIADAQPVSSYDFEWVTIGDAGNAPYTGPDPLGAFATGRGQVNYEYRIAKHEVTTAQWAEFVNTFSASHLSIANDLLPGSWGAWYDPDYSGPGERFVYAPQDAMDPVLSIDWRTASRYVNWLNNGKSSDPTSLEFGAYDTSTYTRNADGSLNDQRAHSAGADFWIPTLDEWMKAAHWDPNRYGPGAGGYWLYSHSSDVAPVPGLPGIGETSVGIGDLGWFGIPLGAYPDVQSPWGLLDTSGAASEWVEEWMSDRYRLAKGGYAGYTGDASIDHIAYGFGGHPSSAGFTGLRLASRVPAPGTIFVMAPCLVLAIRRRR